MRYTGTLTQQGSGIEYAHDMDLMAALDWYARKVALSRGLGYVLVDEGKAEDQTYCQLARTTRTGRKERTSFVAIMVKRTGY